MNHEKDLPIDEWERRRLARLRNPRDARRQAGRLDRRAIVVQREIESRQATGRQAEATDPDLAGQVAADRTADAGHPDVG